MRRGVFLSTAERRDRTMVKEPAKPIPIVPALRSPTLRRRSLIELLASSSRDRSQRRGQRKTAAASRRFSGGVCAPTKPAVSYRNCIPTWLPSSSKLAFCLDRFHLARRQQKLIRP